MSEILSYFYKFLFFVGERFLVFLQFVCGVLEFIEFIESYLIESYLIIGLSSALYTL